jgi:hypothetical protein
MSIDASVPPHLVNTAIREGMDDVWQAGTARHRFSALVDSAVEGARLYAVPALRDLASPSPQAHRLRFAGDLAIAPQHWHTRQLWLPAISRTFG